MTVEDRVRYASLANALINWSLSLPTLLDPAAMAARLGGPEPNYPFLVRLWAAFVFMFGCMFWETSRDVRGKAALLKYNWIEKSVTASCVTLGYWSGEVPARLAGLIFLTNWLWIPLLVHLDLRLRCRTCAASTLQACDLRESPGRR